MGEKTFKLQGEIVMAYLVVNPNAERYEMTSTWSGTPRLKVASSYLPLTTDTSKPTQGITNTIRVNVSDSSYRVMKLSSTTQEATNTITITRSTCSESTYSGGRATFSMAIKYTYHSYTSYRTGTDYIKVIATNLTSMYVTSSRTNQGYTTRYTGTRLILQGSMSTGSRYNSSVSYTITTVFRTGTSLWTYPSRGVSYTFSAISFDVTNAFTSSSSRTGICSCYHTETELITKTISSWL